MYGMHEIELFVNTIGKIPFSKMEIKKIYILLNTAYWKRKTTYINTCLHTHALENVHTLFHKSQKLPRLTVRKSKNGVSSSRCEFKLNEVALTFKFEVILVQETMSINRPRRYCI